MKLPLARSLGWLTLVSSMLSFAAMPAPKPQIVFPRVEQIELHDTLQPERARVFAAQIEHANHDGARAILINLSTPGGISSATDSMVATMRASRIPIIVFTAPANTRISGEGVRLLAEADVAIMMPGNYLTPLWTELPRRISPQTRSEGSKRLTGNLLEALHAHGRSVSAVDELATGIHWFSASEARQAGLIDGIAIRATDALRIASEQPIHRRDGTTIKLDITSGKLDTVITSPQSLLLLSLMNPDLAVLLLTLGLLLIYLEVNTPGTVVPGAAGVLLVLLAGYALQMLPLSTTGLLLCALSVGLLLLEARILAHGVLATLGVFTLVGGLGLLVKGPLPQMEVSWGTAAGAGLGFGGVTACLLVLAAEARRAKVKTGSEAMLGWLAVAQTPLSPDGQILVRGELWRARLTSNDSSVAAGDRVKVLRADGLTLEVTAVPLTQTA